MKKNIIVLSIVSLFVLIGTLPATADWTLDATTTNVLYGANSASTYQVAASGPLEYTLTAAETLSNSYFVTFNLLGGAVFSSNTTVTKLPVTLTPASATLVYLSGGLPGETSIKYIISSVTAATPGTVIQFGVNNAAKLLNVSSLGVNSNVGASISIQNAANAPITTDRTLNAAGKRYVYTCVPLFVVSNNSGQNTVDVNATGGPFTRFIGNSLVSSANSSGLKIGNYGIGIPDQQLQKKKAIITLEGDFSGISKVTFTNANYGWIGCDASGTTTNGTLGQFLIDSTKTKAYVTNNELVPAGDNNANLGVTTDVIFYLDGTTTQLAREFSVSLTNLVDGGVYNASTWLSPVTNFTIKRNGVSVSANSLGPLNTIKITEKSGNVVSGGAQITIVAYDESGVKLAEVSGAPVLLIQNNQTIQLTGDVIAARFTGTPMRYDIYVASTNALISNVKKTAEGFGSTVFTNTNNPDGGAL